MPDAPHHMPILKRTGEAVANTKRLVAASALRRSRSVAVLRAKFAQAALPVYRYEPLNLEPPILVPIPPPLDLACVVRAMLTTGELVPLRVRAAWAGMGSGKACCVCEKPVKDTELEYEAEPIRQRLAGCHFGCFMVWQEESRKLPPNAD